MINYKIMFYLIKLKKVTEEILKRYSQINMEKIFINKPEIDIHK